VFNYYFYNYLLFENTHFWWVLNKVSSAHTYFVNHLHAIRPDPFLTNPKVRRLQTYLLYPSFKFILRQTTPNHTISRMSGASNPPTSSGEDLGITGIRLKHCLTEVLEVRSISLSVFLFQIQIFYVCSKVAC
jgi:hypothetical protein